VADGTTQRIVLVSFDGLSSEQFEQILPFMPKLRRRVEGMRSAHLDASPFASPQPVWAQVLTGQPWYQNGCVGYAQPRGSLNRLQVTTERDLLAPLLPLFAERPGLSINIPLVLPRSNLAWFSDGSMPVQQKVAPQSLADSDLCRGYEPRGFVYLPIARVMSKLAMANCFGVERNRLECAASLAVKERYDWIALRLSIFDELSHVFGHSWLEEPDLWVRESLEELLGFTDGQLETICGDSVTFVFSLFSHTTCYSTLNLNLLLGEGGFLRLHGSEEELAPARAEARRAQALEAISGAEIGTRKNKLQSVEGLILTERSRAASPTSGCIYVNDSKRFFDGCVLPADRMKVKKELVAYLRPRLEKLSPYGVHLFETPDEVDGLVPDCIAFVERAELTDALGLNFQPRTTHAPSGFLYAPQRLLAPWSGRQPARSVASTPRTDDQSFGMGPADFGKLIGELGYGG
jgi:hypothetical protein